MFSHDVERNRYQHVPIEAPEQMLNALPTGVYRTHFNNMGELFFMPEIVSGELLVDVDSDPARRTQREVQDFFDRDITSRLSSAGFKHRRGIILYGEAGTGKTSIVRAMFQHMLDNNAIVLLEPSISELRTRIIPAIRLTDQDRPVAMIFDEFDRVVAGSYRMYLLQLLDGLTSPDHLLTIGTTNFMHRVPRSICERPSRFGLVLNVPALSEHARVNYARAKFPMLDGTVIDFAVRATSNKPLDFLGEALKLYLSGWTEEDIVARFEAIDMKHASALVNDPDDDEDAE